jgi:vitamin B12 transporter
MRRSSPQAGKLFPACIFALFFLFLLFPAFGQEMEEEDFADEFPLMEDDGGITIVGTPETTQQMQSITKEDIEKIHAPDLPALLEQILNLSVTRNGPYGNTADITIRGFDSERTAILIDGIPANSPMSGDFDFTLIDMNSIEKIEIVYGGSDSKYNVSGAFGGIINIITVKKQKPGLRIGGSVSNTSSLPGKYYKRNNVPGDPQWQDLFDTQHISVSAGFGAEKFSWSANLFGNRAANHFLLVDYYNVMRRKENNEVWDTGASASFIWDLPEYAKFIASGDIYYGDKNSPTPSELSSIKGTQTDFSTRQNFMLDMPRIFHDDLAADFSLSYSRQTLDYEAPSENSLYKMHAIQAINRWNWYPITELTLRIGGDYRYAYLDSTNAGIRGRHDGGLYLTVEYAPFKQFIIIPSIKGVTDGHSVVPIPKLGLLWKPLDSFSLKNNYFRSFKFPDLEDLYWNQAGYYSNPDLKPEDGWGTDLIAAYNFKKLFSLESTVYAQQTDNSIHWSNSSGNWRPENVAKAVFFGWDSRIRFEIPVSFGPVKKIIPSFSYKYLLNYILIGRTGDHIGFSSNIRIPYMPLHAMGASLEIQWETGSLLIFGQYEGLRYADYTTTMNLDELDPRFLLNITLNQKINKNLMAFAVLRNALNESYVSMADYHMPGITATVGIKMIFGETGNP